MGGLWGLIAAFIIFVVVSSCTKAQKNTVEIVTSVSEFFADRQQNNIEILYFKPVDVQYTRMIVYPRAFRDVN